MSARLNSPTLRMTAAPLALLAAALLFYWQLAPFASIAGEDFKRMFSGSGPEGLRGWAGLFSRDYSFNFHQSMVYRPMTSVFYRLGWSWFGADIAAYQWSKIALIWGSSVLVYQLALKMGLAARWGFAAALLFLTHGMHGNPLERLAFVDDFLLSFFSLLAVWGHVRLRERKGNGLFLILAIAASYAAALGSKETGLVVPVLFFLYDRAFPRPRPEPAGARRFWPEGAALALVTAGYAALVLRTSPATYGSIGLAGEHPWWKPLERLGAYLLYLAPPHFAGRAAGVFLLFVLLAAALKFKGDAWRRILFCLAWILTGLLPVLNLLGTSTLKEYFEGQQNLLWGRLELPCAGFCWLVAWALAGGESLKRWGRWTVFAALLLIGDNARALRESLLSARAHFADPVIAGEFLRPGYVFAESGFESTLLTLPLLRTLEPAIYEKIAAEVRRAPAAAPGSPIITDLFASDDIYSDVAMYESVLTALSHKGLEGVHRDLASEARRGGDGAVLRYARRIDEAVTLKDEGVELFGRGEVPAAAETLERARKANPENLHTLISLGAVYASQNRLAEALTVYNKALGQRQERRGFYAALLSARANVLARKGNLSGARADRDLAARLEAGGASQ